MNRSADHAALGATAGARPVPAAPDLSLVETLLIRAAEAAAAAGVDLDGFVQAAWSAYVDAHPGLRAQLEDQHLLRHIADLRRRGLVGQS